MSFQQAGDYVEGVLFEVDDFQELDKREDAPKFYQRTLVEVVPVNSNPVSVTTYTVVNKTNKDIKPSKGVFKDYFGWNNQSFCRIPREIKKLFFRIL